MAALLSPRGSVLTATQLVNPLTTLQGNLIAEPRSGRSFIIGKLGKFKDDSDSEKTEDMDGLKNTTFEGNYDFMWQILNGGKCKHQTLRQFNFQQALYDVYFIDESFNMWGTNVPDASGNAQLGGYTLHWKQKTQTTDNNYGIQFRLDDVKQMNENYAYVSLGFNPLNPANLLGVKDVTITATGTAGTFTVTGSVGCGTTNLALLYGSALAAPGAWTVKDNTAVTTLTISGVTLNAAGNAYTFTVTGGSSGDKLNIGLKTIAVTSVSPYNIKYIVSETINDPNFSNATW
jgi:hypothetical protein